MRTTTYKAPDKRRGYDAGEIAGILSQHHPRATVIVRPGWQGQPQQLIVNDPDEYGTEARRARREALGNPGDLDRVECPTPPPTDRLGGPRSFLDDTNRPAEHEQLDGILRATQDEELVREELRAEGVDVAAVERAARRAQERGLGGNE